MTEFKSFQTAATGFCQRSFYSKLPSFVYANGSILSRHGERYFARIIQGWLCLVCFRSHASDEFKPGWFQIDKARQHPYRNSFANATARTLTVIMFAEYDNLLKIDQDRNVAFDYTA